MEIYVDDEAKLTLHGLVQHYIMLNEDEKNRKLNDLLDALDFNQVRDPCSSHTISGLTAAQAGFMFSKCTVPCTVNSQLQASPVSTNKVRLSPCACCASCTCCRDLDLMAAAPWPASSYQLILCF